MRIRKNGKVIRLTESDLRRITKKVLRERFEEEDEDYIYGSDIWGTGIIDHRSGMLDDEDWEETGDEFTEYDEYVESPYCRPGDANCIKRKNYFDSSKRARGGLPLKIFKKPRNKQKYF